jgi:hypothetical protein
MQLTIMILILSQILIIGDIGRVNERMVENSRAYMGLTFE